MNNKDILQRFLFEKASVRGELVHLHQSYQAIMSQHPYPDALKKLLGEALVTVTLLNSIIKFKGRLSLQFQSQSKLKLMLVQCNPELHLRGLLQYDETITTSEIEDSLKTGTLAIMIDPDIEGGKRYQGIVAWQGESLIQSIEAYFRLSEQLPTRLWVAVNETSAAGLLLQTMPNDKPELYQTEWEHLIHLTETLTGAELLSLDNETLLHRLYHDEAVRLFSPQAVSFRCTCSYARSENAIQLLGQDEAEQELEDKQKIVVTCEFCNSEYVFDRADVRAIFKKNEKPSQLH